MIPGKHIAARPPLIPPRVSRPLLSLCFALLLAALVLFVVPLL